jgi:hypothetical protein
MGILSAFIVIKFTDVSLMDESIILNQQSAMEASVTLTNNA